MTVISIRAKDSIDRIFRKAAQTRLPLDSADRCEVAPLAQPLDGVAKDARVVVLTISSILFRLLLIVHVDESESTREYFLKEDVDRSVEDTLLELCNLCCGAMNQELLRDFPDLGMSTPYVLSARCLSHLQELNPALLLSYSITINGSVGLAATVCVCAYAPIDFVADTSAAEETSGELELF